jgi:hypothetical protein
MFLMLPTININSAPSRAGKAPNGADFLLRKRSKYDDQKALWPKKPPKAVRIKIFISSQNDQFFM